MSLIFEKLKHFIFKKVTNYTVKKVTNYIFEKVTNCIFEKLTNYILIIKNVFLSCVRAYNSGTTGPILMKLRMRNLHLIWKISTEKKIGISIFLSGFFLALLGPESPKNKILTIFRRVDLKS